jgi:hypothetical protein
VLRSRVGPLAARPGDARAIEDLFEELDSDRDGVVDYRELSCAIAVVVKAASLSERLRICFAAYDRDDEGSVAGFWLGVLFVFVAECFCWIKFVFFVFLFFLF